MKLTRASRVIVRAVACVALLVSAPRIAAAQQLWFSRWDMKPLALPRAIRDLPGFGDLEYDDTSHAVGLQIDLDRDGHLDYIIRSDRQLCGTGGCDFLIVHGATRRELGSIFGSSVYIDSAPRGQLPLLHALSGSSAVTATWTEFVGRNGKYVQGASRELNERQADSLMHALKDIPRVKASEAPSSRPR